MAWMQTCIKAKNTLSAYKEVTGYTNCIKGALIQINFEIKYVIELQNTQFEETAGIIWSNLSWENQSRQDAPAPCAAESFYLKKNRIAYFLLPLSVSGIFLLFSSHFQVY